MNYQKIKKAELKNSQRMPLETKVENDIFDRKPVEYVQA